MSTSLTWHDVIGKEKEQPYFLDTLAFVANERQAGKTIYPPQKDVFNAFRFTELADVKVVILGKIPITARTRPMACRFPCAQASLRRLHWSICTKSW